MSTCIVAAQDIGLSKLVAIIKGNEGNPHSGSEWLTLDEAFEWGGRVRHDERVGRAGMGNE